MLSSLELHAHYDKNNFSKTKELFKFLNEDGKEEEGLSFEKLDEYATANAKQLLTTHKLSTGDTIVLMFAPGLDFMKALLGIIWLFFTNLIHIIQGCLYAGVIAVPLSVPPPSQLQKVNTRRVRIFVYFLSS